MRTDGEEKTAPKRPRLLRSQVGYPRVARGAEPQRHGRLGDGRDKTAGEVEGEIPKPGECVLVVLDRKDRRLSRMWSRLP